MEMIAPLCRPVIQFRTDTKMPYEVAYVTLTFQKSGPLNPEDIPDVLSKSRPIRPPPAT